MIHAWIRGKLSREQENAEDLLTSNVFGLLSYLPPDKGLLNFLAQSQAIDGEHALNWLVGPSALGAKMSLEFWPFWQEAGCISCEPDVVIRLQFENRPKIIILLEAKFRSGKSSIANTVDNRPYDQLAREWDNLVRVAAREVADPYQIYVTSNIGIPRAEIDESIKEYRSKRLDDGRLPKMLALSWRQLPEVLRQNNEPMARDLCALADRLTLRYFHGFQFNCSISSLTWNWQFCRWPARWTRLAKPPNYLWRFVR